LVAQARFCRGEGVEALVQLHAGGTMAGQVQQNTRSCTGAGLRQRHVHTHKYSWCGSVRCGQQLGRSTHAHMRSRVGAHNPRTWRQHVSWLNRSPAAHAGSREGMAAKPPSDEIRLLHERVSDCCSRRCGAAALASVAYAVGGAVGGSSCVAAAAVARPGAAGRRHKGRAVLQR
jgi:hypothetical protein